MIKMFAREELYETVWSESISSLAKKYKVSDYALRKVCKRMNIPLPNNGYWSKLKYNKPAEKEELPTNFSGEKEINLSEGDKDAIQVNSAIHRTNAIRKSYNALDQSIFKVPAKLTNPDKLVTIAYKTLINQKSNEWSRWLIHTYPGEININVSPKNVGRALRIFDTIIKLLRSRGHDVIINRSETHAIIEGEKFEIALREKLRIERIQENYSWKTNVYFTTDKLIFRVDHGYRMKEFTDDKILLEEKLPLILAHLEFRGQKEKEKRIEYEIHRANEREKERIEKEHKERKDKEINDFKNLLKESNSWHQSVILDNYLKEVERRAVENNTLTDELTEWLKWAKSKAEWYNPFIRKEDDILSKEDRLFF
jgi:hypothetical protein